MDIATTGSGNVGTALARSAARVGHRVSVTSRETEQAAGLGRSVGARRFASNDEGMAWIDISLAKQNGGPWQRARWIAGRRA